MLKQLVSRDPMYPNPRFRAGFEAQARRNMEEELSRLREG